VLLATLEKVSVYTLLVFYSRTHFFLTKFERAVENTLPVSHSYSKDFIYFSFFSSI
jgi:hypothetical protein